MIIFLIGMPGAGKSTLAKSFCKENTSFVFFDTDIEIEKKLNKSILNIFNEEGQIYFREQETSILKNLDSKKNIICATGGGVILKDENIKLMKEKGILIYLNCNISTLENRLKNNSTRPLLKDKKLIELYNERKDIYKLNADYIINRNKTIKENMKELKLIYEKENFSN